MKGLLYKRSVVQQLPYFVSAEKDRQEMEYGLYSIVP